MGYQIKMKCSFSILLSVVLLTACSTLNAAQVQAHRTALLSAASDVRTQANFFMQTDSLPECITSMTEDCRFLNTNDYVGSYIDDSEWKNMLLLKPEDLQPVLSKTPKGSKPIRAFQLVSTVDDTANVTRYTYTFYKTGILVQTDIPTLYIVQSDYYKVNAASYNSFLKVLDGIHSRTTKWHPTWPLYAVRQNVEKMTFVSADKKYSKSYVSPLDSRHSTWTVTAWVDPVLPKSAKVVEKDTRLKDAVRITINYSTGAVFDIWQNETETLVTASNMVYGVYYADSASEDRKWALFFIDKLSKGKGLPMLT